jgi:hypothetical protein
MVLDSACKSSRRQCGIHMYRVSDQNLYTIRIFASPEPACQMLRVYFPENCFSILAIDVGYRKIYEKKGFVCFSSEMMGHTLPLAKRL